MDSQSIVVRKAVLSDALGMSEVHIASWRAAYHGLLPAALLAGLDLDARTERWRQILSDPENPNTNLVALEEQRVVGFAGFGPARDEELDSEVVAEIPAIYLRPDYFRRGLGTRLFEACVEQLPDRYQALVLWVLQGNSRAHHFYERHGFAADGAEKVKAMQGAELPCLRMRRELA